MDGNGSDFILSVNGKEKIYSYVTAIWKIRVLFSQREFEI